MVIFSKISNKDENLKISYTKRTKILEVLDLDRLRKNKNTSKNCLLKELENAVPFNLFDNARDGTP